MLARIVESSQRLRRMAKLILIASLMLWSPSPSVINIHPTQGTEMPLVAAQVRVMNISGSGTVLRSSEEGTDILTNRHVCELAPKLSYSSIELGSKQYKVIAIKPSNIADLCLVRIRENLRINTNLAPESPKIGDPIIVAGYPLAMPLLVQGGFASEVFDAGFVESEPVLLTSVMVQPGSSGSGVWNSDGELVGVILAYKYENANAGIGFGLAVPLSYVKRFVNKESLSLPWIAVPDAPERP